MARIQSAPRKIVKVLMCRPGIEPGTSHLPGECSTTELPTPLYYLCSPEHILLLDIHVWDVTHLVMAEQPHYRSYILVLISTYQVSSAWLEYRALQRKIVKVLVCRPGIEPGTSRLPGECSDHWATDTFVLSVQSWAYIIEFKTSMYEMWRI